MLGHILMESYILIRIKSRYRAYHNSRDDSTFRNHLFTETYILCMKVVGMGVKKKPKNLRMNF